MDEPTPCRWSTTKEQRARAWRGLDGGMKDQHRCLEHGGFQYEPGEGDCYRRDDAKRPNKESK